MVVADHVPDAISTVQISRLPTNQMAINSSLGTHTYRQTTAQSLPRVALDGLIRAMIQRRTDPPFAPLNLSPPIHFPFCPSSASGLVGDIPITLPLVLRIFRLFFGHWTADFSEFLWVKSFHFSSSVGCSEVGEKCILISLLRFSIFFFLFCFFGISKFFLVWILVYWNSDSFFLWLFQCGWRCFSCWSRLYVVTPRTLGFIAMNSTCFRWIRDLA